ncbi:hypothetical protein MJH12_13455 [bacterium]|nr:hypothetical protein [bacterium]
MKTTFKDILGFGMGSAMLAKEVAEDFVDEMIRSGNAKNEQRAEMVHDMSDRALGTLKDYEENFKVKFGEFASELNLATKHDIDELKAMIKDLKESQSGSSSEESLSKKSVSESSSKESLDKESELVSSSEESADKEN